MDDDLKTWLLRNREHRAAALETVEQLDTELTERVQRALQEGRATAAEIADVLGVTRARVYQIRDGRR
ncbi:hypothetical protein FGG23_gp025 [Mycobacterium phage Ibhubesi]|uniref:Uncharacterized protein n=2 Tax=Cheoctovirus TaxID=1623281 RepID=A0A346FBW5_9CAUD|nr:hypothetical protein FGG23_gp025 [Mycobacterium phage Ibhubesi]YP_009957846.1 hypothetical protein I5H45_gp025 [Mycobacterium phage Harley]AEK09121.1 hypothetical protein PBI_IBHUBESI_25 [Mycobacterium phage Ibhubesi]AXN53190.1 hypothetical protein PBI_HARLEY_25 [Mycobacterium phage Harley]